MNRLRKSFVIGVACLVFATIPATGWAVTEPCEKNFIVKDGFLDRKIYKTWQELQALTRQAIFMRTYTYLLKGGWVINLTDEETGVISASQVDGSSGSTGKVANLNILIENAGNYYGGAASKRGVPAGFRVTMTFSVPGGLDAHEDMVRKEFCAALAEIKGGTYAAR